MMPVKSVAMIAAILGGFLLPALAQHNHSDGHDVYRTWKSPRAPQSCCNEQDCSGIDDSEVRQTATGTQVRIDGEWCPVLSIHYLIPGSGKSPDWAVNHACVRKYSSASPCERLLCFMPKGGF
jgi:hypothetical protein